jgi:ABC-2 type transport system ATP-binding protein
MSLQVEKLTKIYGSQTVLDAISFEAKKGEILGFLGPNGAGKTTTMKVITGFTKADSGYVNVCGINVDKNPMETKSRIGYLPEHNPLYSNMFIKEFLGFVADLHGVKNQKQIIADLIHKTGLEKEQHKQIKMLSKGYRQRVGLAQALLHDPEVLILDEPTSGLDPNQLEDIRSVIRELGREKTVVFSSHIMQEVQALCDRVIIINNGQIVADDKIGDLDKYLGVNHEQVMVQFEQEIDKDLFSGLNGFIEIVSHDNHSYQIQCHSEIEMRKQLFEMAKQKNLPLIGLQKQDVSIENVFQALTKK